MFKKTGVINNSTISVHDPKTGKTSVTCRSCGAVQSTRMSKQAFIKGEPVTEACSSCRKPINP